VPLRALLVASSPLAEGPLAVRNASLVDGTGGAAKGIQGEAVIDRTRLEIPANGARP
jgi:hypothetical protein